MEVKIKDWTLTLSTQKWKTEIGKGPAHKANPSVFTEVKIKDLLALTSVDVIWRHEQNFRTPIKNSIPLAVQHLDNHGDFAIKIPQGRTFVQSTIPFSKNDSLKGHPK